MKKLILDNVNANYTKKLFFFSEIRLKFELFFLNDEIYYSILHIFYEINVNKITKYSK